MEPCAKYQKTQAGARGGNNYKMDLVFTIKDVPDYQILAHAHVEETLVSPNKEESRCLLR